MSAPKVEYVRDGRIGRIRLNRPEVLNAIDDDLPAALSAAVEQADADPRVHVLLLSGNGSAFCAGYDLRRYAEERGLEHASAESNGPESTSPEGTNPRDNGIPAQSANPVVQKMPWDPLQDYAFMWRNTQHFMSLWRAMKPVICKVHGFAVAGGSDIALCADLTVMGERAQIGYMPARVWGVPTTAMWVYRIGAEKAKRMLLCGDKISGKEAEAIGLVLRAVPEDLLDAEVETLAERLATVPINQLAMQKMLINQAVEAQGLFQTQRLATFFDGIARHSPEGLNFQRRSTEQGWKQAVRERDQGLFDWTRNAPF